MTLRKLIAAAAVLALALARADAQGIPGLPMVPLWQCQLSATQLTSAVSISQCVAANFTASSGSGANANQLTVSAVTNGEIAVGQSIISGTGLTAGTTITAQVSGTPGGVGVYTLSANGTAASASVASGGVPPNTDYVVLQAESANVRYRDDGAAPTSAIGLQIVSALAPFPYVGTIAQLKFIGASGAILDIGFYQVPGQ